MDKIYILEIWLDGVHGSKRLSTVGAFIDKEVMERYQLLNPSKKHLNQFYDYHELNVIKAV